MEGEGRAAFRERLDLESTFSLVGLAGQKTHLETVGMEVGIHLDRASSVLEAWDCLQLALRQRMNL